MTCKENIQLKIKRVYVSINVHYNFFNPILNNFLAHKVALEHYYCHVVFKQNAQGFNLLGVL